MRRALASLAITVGLAVVYACADDPPDPAQPGGGVKGGVDAPIDAATSPDAEVPIEWAGLTIDFQRC